MVLKAMDFNGKCQMFEQEKKVPLFSLKVQNLSSNIKNPKSKPECRSVRED